MKRLMLPFCYVAVLLLYGNTLSALTNKALKKECKMMTKQLKKEGWKVFGSVQSLEVALTNHYEKRELMEDDDILIVGRAIGSNENIAKNKAHNDAATQYATMSNICIVSEDGIEIANVREGEDVNTKENFSSISHVRAEQRVHSLQPGLTLSRKLDDGKVEIMIHYITKREQ